MDRKGQLEWQQCQQRQKGWRPQRALAWPIKAVGDSTGQERSCLDLALVRPIKNRWAVVRLESGRARIFSGASRSI